MDTLSSLLDCIDLREYMSLIVHPLASVIDNSPDLQAQAMTTLCAAAKQFGSRYFCLFKCFVLIGKPLVKLTVTTSTEVISDFLNAMEVSFNSQPNILKD